MGGRIEEGVIVKDGENERGNGACYRAGGFGELWERFARPRRT